MRYEVSDLVKEVRIALDKNMSSVPLAELGDVDTLSVDEIIRSKIEDAARIVEVNAPARLLDSGRAFGTSIGWDSTEGYGSGHIHLPDDFLRLVTFQMSDWDYAVTNPITEDDPVYQRQHSRFGGVRGCPQRPVVAITQQPIGLVLEFYSCTQGKGVFVRRARYIPIPKIRNAFNGMTGEPDPNGAEVIELCEKLKPAVVYYTAYLTALAVGERERATTLLGTSQELMELEPTNIEPTTTNE